MKTKINEMKKSLEVFTIQKRIKNNNRNRNIFLVVFLAATGFGVVFQNLISILLGILIYLLMDSANTSIKLDKIMLKLMEDKKNGF